jgi:hypothetical protein
MASSPTHRLDAARTDEPGSAPTLIPGADWFTVLSIDESMIPVA